MRSGDRTNKVQVKLGSLEKFLLFEKNWRFSHNGYANSEFLLELQFRDIAFCLSVWKT